jgi:hypothetical protein
MKPSRLIFTILLVSSVAVVQLAAQQTKADQRPIEQVIGRKQLCKLAERLVGVTMSSHAAKRSTWNDSLYLTEVIVFAGYQLQFEPALLVV